MNTYGQDEREYQHKKIPQDSISHACIVLCVCVRVFSSLTFRPQQCVCVCVCDFVMSVKYASALTINAAIRALGKASRHPVQTLVNAASARVRVCVCCDDPIRPLQGPLFGGTGAR